MIFDRYLQENSKPNDVKNRVVINLPNHTELLHKGFTMVDMHSHTRFSDSFTKVQHLLRKAQEEGYGVAITDHNEIKGVLRAYELNHDVMVIPGIEVSSMEGPHILVYFKELEDLKDFYYNHVQHTKTSNPNSNTTLSIPELMRVTRGYDCLVSVAHPYSVAYTNLPNNVDKGFIDPKFLDEVDAVEVVNSAVTPAMNESATEMAHILGKGITGGSDSHSLHELGETVTYAKASNVAEFLDAIKEHRSFVVGKPSNQVKRIPTYYKNLHKHSKYLIPSIRQRYEQMILKPVRYHKPKVTAKLRNIKWTSTEMWQNPGIIPEKLKIVYKPLKIVIKGTKKIFSRKE